MARISVVVPIYDVETYLDECLRSVAAQTHEDLEVVMVDDGSTDGSAAIAERHASRDPRFRLIRQANGGLSAARNTGTAAATGEYLAFLDSDDRLPPDAYERLLRSLEATGSDFATGNVQRLTRDGLAQAPFLAKAFARTRQRTHVRRFEPLLSDRTAWNKLWRRSFWDGCALRFPEGRIHEDIPVVLPAHFRAAGVDVVAAPVYHYRRRDDEGAPSITQRRLELRALRDRLTAIEEVCDHLARHERPRQLRRYQRSVVAADLRYHLDLLDQATLEYRYLFLERANALLDRADRRVLDRLPAIDRAKWLLVRHRRLPELLDLLRFQREEALHAVPARRRGRYYADYPVTRLPRAARRLGRRDQELALTAHLEDVRFSDGRLRLTGHAYVNALGAGGPERQRIELGAVRPGRGRSLRMRAAARAIPTAPIRRGDLDPGIRWAGFHASLDASALPAGEEWELFADARSGGVRRRRARFVLADPALARTVDALEGGVLTVARVTADGRATVARETCWVRLEEHRLLPGAQLELAGGARLGAGDAAELELAGAGAPLRLPLAHDDYGVTVRVPLEPLLSGGEDAEWTLRVVTPRAAPRLVLAEWLAGAAWRSGGRDMGLVRAADGGARLVVREPARVPVPRPAAGAEVSAPRAA